MNEVVIKNLNDPAASEALLVALDIFIPDTPVVRIVNNSENITFKEQTYIALNFELGELVAEKGTTPQVTLRLDNTTRALQSYINDYDLYLKTHGVQNSTIKATVYVLNTIDLSEAVYEDEFELTNFSADAQWVSFTLGSISLFNLSYPPRRMYKDFCGFKFKSPECGYAGSALVCDKSLACCKRLHNSPRFGGFVGISGGYRQ